MDPSNIVHSLKKRPILHILDDPCTLSEFERIHYPADSDVCLGERKGCFEKTLPKALTLALDLA